MINAKAVMDKNFIDCLPEGYTVTEMNKTKDQTGGDYDADGIFELSFIVQKEDVVKLLIIERDTLGNCSQKFESGNLTPKLLSNFLGFRLANSTTTRFGGPKGTTQNLFFEYRSDESNLKLTFHGDQTDGYYLLSSEYIRHETKKDKGQIVVQDFLKRERKVMPKIGSRESRTVETLPKKLYPLESLNYDSIMALVK